MKKIVFLIIAFAATISCGSKTMSTPSDAASTKESEVSGSQNNVAAVVKQVNAIYDYWNDLKDHYDENKPSVDERFGSKEWWQIRQEVAAIDRECECGGFFDFGEEGPLDPWTYDCYEGTVSANDIQVKFQPTLQVLQLSMVTNCKKVQLPSLQKILLIAQRHMLTNTTDGRA